MDRRAFGFLCKRDPWIGSRKPEIYGMVNLNKNVKIKAKFLPRFFDLDAEYVNNFENKSTKSGFFISIMTSKKYLIIQVHDNSEKTYLDYINSNI